MVMNKLEYWLESEGGKAREANWNMRPGDVAHLGRWAGRQFCLWDLREQIVNLKDNPDEWHGAGILYIAGNQCFDLPARDAAKIRRFVEDGGMVLANADCGSVEFAKSIEKFGRSFFRGRRFEICRMSIRF